MTELRVTKSGKVYDKKGKELVNDGSLNDLTSKFLDAWNSAPRKEPKKSAPPKKTKNT
jgi:hypothetical protein